MLDEVNILCCGGSVCSTSAIMKISQPPPPPPQELQGIIRGSVKTEEEEEGDGRFTVWVRLWRQSVSEYAVDEDAEEEEEDDYKDGGSPLLEF